MTNRKEGFIITVVHKIVDIGEEVYTMGATKNLNLRGRIISVYGTIGKFALALNWSRRKASDIVNGNQEATASDIEQMANALNVELPEDFRLLFLI